MKNEIAMNSRIEIRVSAEERAAVQDKAKELNISMSELMRELINKYVQENDGNE